MPLLVDIHTRTRREQEGQRRRWSGRRRRGSGEWTQQTTPLHYVTQRVSVVCRARFRQEVHWARSSRMSVMRCERIQLVGSGARQCGSGAASACNIVMCCTQHCAARWFVTALSDRVTNTDNQCTTCAEDNRDLKPQRLPLSLTVMHCDDHTRAPLAAEVSLTPHSSPQFYSR